MTRGIVAAAATAALLALSGCSGALPAVTTAAVSSVHGCGPNGKHLPDRSVEQRRILDVDLDGRPDTLVHWQNPDTWGVRTAAGAVITVRSPDAHPKRWHGWMLQLEADPAVLVVDDGEQADPYFLVGCRLVRPKGVNGRPYVFSLYPRDGYGTGVTCAGSDRGGYELAGVYAALQENDLYRLQTTAVSSRDGRILRNQPVQVGLTYFKGTSATVKNARRSYCPRTPLLSGRLGGGR